LGATRCQLGIDCRSFNDRGIQQRERFAVQIPLRTALGRGSHEIVTMRGEIIVAHHTEIGGVGEQSSQMLQAGYSHFIRMPYGPERVKHRRI